MQDLQNLSNQSDNEEWLSIGQAAELLNVSRDTLRRWEKRDKVKAYRSPTNRRYYKKVELENLFGRAQTMKASTAVPQPSVSQPVERAASPRVTVEHATVTPRQSYAVTPQPSDAANSVAMQTSATTNHPTTEGQDNINKEQLTVRESESSSETSERANRSGVVVETETKQVEAVQKQEQEMEILEIEPQPSSSATGSNEQQMGENQVQEQVKGEKKKSINYLKVAILVVSVFLIIAGLAIVGLVFLFPSQSTTSVLSPV